MQQNYILDAANVAQPAIAPVDASARDAATMSGLPLGQTAEGTIFVRFGGLGTDGAVPTEASGSATTPLTTRNIVNAVGENNYDIPVDAIEWTVAILEGSALVDGVPVTAGFTDSSTTRMNTPLSIYVNAASRAYIRYNIPV